MQILINAQVHSTVLVIMRSNYTFAPLFTWVSKTIGHWALVQGAKNRLLEQNTVRHRWVLDPIKALFVLPTFPALSLTFPSNPMEWKVKSFSS